MFLCFQKQATDFTHSTRLTLNNVGDFLVSYSTRFRPYLSYMSGSTTANTRLTAIMTDPTYQSFQVILIFFLFLIFLKKIFWCHIPRVLDLILVICLVVPLLILV